MQDDVPLQFVKQARTRQKKTMGRQQGCLYAARLFCVEKKFKKVKKICFFLQNAFDKRFSCAILLVLTG
jgi:hypothetical protein